MTSFISIHPPRAGRDDPSDSDFAKLGLFQSTRPVRGGTPLRNPRIQLLFISIHPPRAGRDHTAIAARGGCTHFNPPAPCGAGRPKIPIAPPISNFNPPAPCGAGPEDEGICAAHQKFQSTRPVRGGTVLGVQTHIPKRISIHPPRAGRDMMPCRIV